MLKKISVTLTCVFPLSLAWSKAIIDPDVEAIINKSHPKVLNSQYASHTSTIIFLHSKKEAHLFIADLKKLPHVFAKKFDSIPAVLVSLPTDPLILDTIANHPAAMQITSF